MKIGDHKVFLDKEKLYLLINYRLNGFSISTLAIIFGVDKSSIRYQVQKFYIQNPTEVYGIEAIMSPIIAQHQPSEWEVIEGMKVNPGSNYADYVKRSTLSPLRK